MHGGEESSVCMAFQVLTYVANECVGNGWHVDPTAVGGEDFQTLSHYGGC